MGILLETVNLTMTIGNKKIYPDLNWQIQPGEIWAVLGCNGMGKTTLLHSLAGLRQISAGEIYLNQQSLLSYSRREIAQNIGLLFQFLEDTPLNTVINSVLSARHPHLNLWRNMNS